VGNIFAQTIGAKVIMPSEDAYILIVDSSYENTDENGTEAKPFKTIQRAVEQAGLLVARENRDVRILIKPGMGYRETVVIDSEPSLVRKSILALEAFDREEPPLLSGSELWNGESFQLAEPNKGHSVFFHAWNGPQFGKQLDLWTEYDFHLPDVVRRRELVRLGDWPLRQVMSYEELVPGSFFVNDHVGSLGFGNYFICPPNGTSMVAGTAFEVARRSSVVEINNRENVILRGVRLQGSADYFQGALTIEHSRNIRVEDCEFSYCCSYGANVSHSSEITFVNNRFYKNGIAGLCGGYVRDLLVEGGTVALNNWRGAYADLDEWDSAGIKFFQLHQSRFAHIICTGNLGKAMGIWLDTDIENATLTRCICSNNHFGFFYEASRGPCTVEDCEFSHNRIGIYSSAADDLRVRRTILSNNSGEGQLVVFGHSDEGGRSFINFETMRTYKVLGKNFEFTDNSIFWDANDDKVPLVSARGIDIDAYRRFQASFRGTGNRYWHSQHQDVFLDGRDSTFIGFEEWKSQLKPGEDSSSSWSNQPN
jgi:hypothetical protein